jgi:hypothetical protein
MLLASCQHAGDDVLNDSLTFLNITPGLTRITVTPNADKTQFRVRFDFGVSPPRESLTLHMSATGLMGLKLALEQVQARHKLRIPEPLRRKGKPSLTIVRK